MSLEVDIKEDSGFCDTCGGVASVTFSATIDGEEVLSFEYDDHLGGLDVALDKYQVTEEGYFSGYDTDMFVKGMQLVYKHFEGVVEERDKYRQELDGVLKMIGDTNE
jgi:hypothetical protein